MFCTCTIANNDNILHPITTTNIIIINLSKVGFPQLSLPLLNCTAFNYHSQYRCIHLLINSHCQHHHPLEHSYHYLYHGTVYEEHSHHRYHHNTLHLHSTTTTRTTTKPTQCTVQLPQLLSTITPTTATTTCSAQSTVPTICCLEEAAWVQTKVGRGRRDGWQEEEEEEMAGHVRNQVKRDESIRV